MADAKTLKSVKTSVDSGFESTRHSAKSYRTFRTLKTRHSSESAVTLLSKKTKNSYFTQSSKRLNSGNTNLGSLRGTCNTPKSLESRETLKSRERQAIMGVLPTIKEFKRKKELEGLSRDPTYNNSEQLVFYDSHGQQVTDRLSSYDSGITKDISNMSYQRGHQGFGAMLSPVKSESASPRPHSHTSPRSSKDWRKFFDMLPNAAEHRQMEQIRREMEAGKLKPTTLPPISYFAEDLPMLPGEAGTRLLQTVRVGEKVPHQGDGRHRIESVPGKLAVHTQNEHAGLSNYGILQMQWTTDVPSVRDRSHPPRKIPQHRHQGTMQDYNESDVVQMPNSNRLREFSEEDLHLPHLEAATPQLTNHLSANHYEWELPLPPPPAKESRTNVAAVKKEHDAYCKYYQLVKKKLHLYTSQKRERTQHLPEVFVKQLKEGHEGQAKSGSKRPQQSRTLTKSDLNPSHFPPIKIGQLIRI